MRSAAILPSVVITQKGWRGVESAVARSVIDRFAFSGPLIVRSSRLDEGQGLVSDAGAFLSVGDVEGERALIEAVEAVLESYGRVDPGDEVLIQPMAGRLVGSGVATNYDLRTQQPYWVIELATGSDSAVVTAGKAAARSFSLLRRNGVALPPEVRPVVAMLEELEALFPDAAIEIEFGLTDDGAILFQCRATPIGSGEAARAALLRRTGEAAAQLEQILQDSVDRFGAAAFGVMPDWNPAEMIGLKPTPLAYDLYAHLITNRTWSAARRDQGYTEVAVPLMVKVLGTPFINIGASLTSFVPADASPGVRRRVVTACVDQLRRRPHWHDRIEFELVPTCHRPGGLGRAWLTEAMTCAERATYDQAMLALTNDLVRSGGGFDRDFALIGGLRSLMEDIRDRPVGDRPAFAALLAMARDMAAPLFARVARAAFVATDLVRYAAEKAGLDAPELLGPVQTVAVALMVDYQTGDFETFIRRHGHIRPGTYDIRTPSYEEAPELYFKAGGLCPAAIDAEETPLRRPLRDPLALAFRDAGYAFTADDFVHFARRAIAAREQVKYLYAGLLSEALAQLARSAGRHGVGRDLLAFASLAEAGRLQAPAGPPPGLRADLEARRLTWADDSALRAPSLLFSPDDVFAYEDLQSAPNFITRARVLAPTAQIGKGAAVDCRGCIVVTEQADPGFDWIFTRGAAGLVTAYGGLNSHMAVRCREMRLPAVIGIGPVLFEKVRHARLLEIDCASQRLEICR
jgi:phosphohistidine swiveling domain-containing protein